MAAVVLAGCAGAPDRTPAGLATPARFETLPPGHPSLTRWWTRFGAPDLTRLVEAAGRGNFDILAAAARLEQADAQARIVGAALLPALTASAAGSYAQSSGTTGSGVRPASRSGFVNGVLAASFELDLWGRNRDALRAALQVAEAAGYEEQVVRLSVQAAVVNAWLQLAAAQDRAALAEGNLANALRVLAVINARVAAGTGSALDRAQQESLVANLRATIPAFRQTAATARTALALLIGEPVNRLRPGRASLRTLRTPAAAPGLPSALLLRRPDIRRAEALLAAADADVAAARKALLPTIRLTADGGYASAALHTLIRPESLIWSLAAGLVQPIFDGGRLQAAAALSEAQRRELLELYRRAIVAGFVDVENALIAVRESTARLAARLVAVAKAREAFGLAERQLTEGTIDLQTLLNTQATLFQAEDGLIMDRLARLQAAVSLAQALGGDVLAGADPGGGNVSGGDVIARP
jgi:NodT family efflux transporter outer membrane factor (OMF) lipoprotein